MERITEPMFRYGDPDWDRDYLRWGFHDEATQREEAESVLRLVGAAGPLRILDLACGPGVHAVQWAKQGHQVTGVDLSETFLSEGRKRAAEAGVSVAFEAADIRHLTYQGEFDLVTWIDRSFLDADVVRAIGRYLAAGGCFVLDARNPEHPRSRQRSGNWRTWREENGVFFLERHETDAATGLRQSAWIQINPHTGQITEKTTPPRPPSAGLPDDLRLLSEGGFTAIEVRTMEGALFQGGEEPYWLWVVCRP